MAETHVPPLAVLIIAAFSRHAEALDWGRQQAKEQFGSLQFQSPCFDFVQTDYYEKSMGRDLKKQLWAFAPLIPLDHLPAIKLQTNAWEAEFAARGDWDPPRPLNLDPGYVTEAKLVLATTKNRDHRLYLDQGIFGEVTLHYHRKQWRSWPWTYPDYEQPGYHAFLDDCRQYLRQQLKHKS